MKPGVTSEQAQSEMGTIGARLAQEYPDFNTNWSVNVVPLRQQLSGELRRPLMVLLALVLSLSIKTLIPAPQPAAQNTPANPALPTLTPAPDPLETKALRILTHPEAP